MPAVKSPAVIVVCGVASGAPKTARHGHHGGTSLPVPVTWIATAERLQAVAAAVSGARAHHDFVLQVPAAAFESRQRLRRLLAMGREAVPSLEAIAVHGGAAVGHRPLLVEEGVRVVLVDTLTGYGRGSRRPAPAGWRCHNPAWGLWEVEMAPASRRGPLSVFGLSSRPGVRRGGLAVLGTDAWDSQGMACHRLDRLATWAAGRTARQGAEATTLSGLAARLAGDDQQAITGSVLRAA
jgi:hypothetical protein